MAAPDPGFRPELSGASRWPRSDPAPGAGPLAGPATLSGLSAVLDLLGLVVPVFTLVSGLFYYFGWVRAGATFDYFGVDRSVLDFSSQDYLLRSVGVAFRPAAVVLLLFGVLAMLRAGLRFDWSAHRYPRTGPVVRWTLVALSLSLGMIGFAGVASWPVLSPLPSALALGVGALLAHALLERKGGPLVRQVGPPVRFGGERGLLRMLLIVVFVLATFWGTAVYAQASGSRLARSIELHALARPGVVVYSQQRLQITGPGVGVTETAGTDLAYRFRYSGLRLLIRTPNHWLLMPEGWNRGNGATIIRVAEDPTLRMDLLPPH